LLFISDRVIAVQNTKTADHDHDDAVSVG